ncbi:MAG TPA: histidine triad nucleotide-binding protein [bacterium]|nr:histidine triad nucleotide-binding protein [bacterium]
MACIFCQIINKEAPAKIVYEDEKIIAFKDIHPVAPVHILVVPKRHIDSVEDLKEEDRELAGRLILVAKKVARQFSINKSGYKLVFNVGRGGGQIIDHIHLHLIGGWKKNAIRS